MTKEGEGMTTKERLYGHMISDKVYFSKQLDYLGISRNYTGYFMLVDILSIIIGRDERVESFSSEIYPIVAKKYNKSECTIERNIRNLIDKCWSEEMMKQLNVFNPMMIKPTCRDFIFYVKNFIVRQIL